MKTAVETKQLKRAVRRNISRFPSDFMFELNEGELKDWRCQFGTSNRETMGLRILPFSFTEQGVLMLASVLKSERAVQVNIQIVRVFIKMQELLMNHKEYIGKIKQFEEKLSGYDEKIQVIFEYLKQLEQSKQEEVEFKDRKRIGFSRTDET